MEQQIQKTNEQIRLVVNGGHLGPLAGPGRSPSVAPIGAKPLCRKWFSGFCNSYGGLFRELSQIKIKAFRMSGTFLRIISESASFKTTVVKHFAIAIEASQRSLNTIAKSPTGLFSSCFFRVITDSQKETMT